jgi:NTE family protein
LHTCQPKIALVLGAGSARGLAHIGVLQVLEENNIPFDLIVGCSMGAMVGSIYACGTDLKLLEKLIENMNLRNFFDLNIPRMGFISGKRITEFLDLVTKRKNFADLDLPLAVVATDLVSGSKLVIEEGPITEAVRASISIPGVFHPIIKDDMVLVDGAVLDRLPVEVAREKGASVIIAVDVNFGPGKKVMVKNTMDIILNSLDLMQKKQFDLLEPQTDILIQPQVGNYSPADFDKSPQLIQLGREATEACLPKIMAILEQHR